MTTTKQSGSAIKNFIIQPLFYIITIIILTATSCTKDRVTGSGSIISQTRNADPLHGISVSGNNKVTVTYGTTQQLTLTGYENLLPYFETNVRNGILEVGYKNNTHIKNDNIEIAIMVPAFDKAMLSGSGELSVNGFNGNSLSLDLSGSNNVSVVSSYANADISMSGSGNVNGAEFKTKKATTHISGSGTIELSCSDNLTAHISGSGNIYYWGSPSLDVSVSGSGKVVKK
ncbi:DUF2807 domain-containing protein [Danxiaibacter flavus]|uniref:DUF2807 domain-containing protein n=1 Tax=Danxiaibacter flavus TaxID=3049108 RepID=A0ABV3ZP09_9BACT|nr:DUF2807 domain-containing protein [Chitinophagaceae bacterium DXS]